MDKSGATAIPPGSWTDGREGGIWDDDELLEVGGGVRAFRDGMEIGGGACTEAASGVSRTAASLCVLHGLRGVLSFQAV